MTATPTLNSRLRVLIAKTFRAEKLYSALPTGGGEHLAQPGALAQLANDIRAKEWQRGHYQLRVALNDLLAEGNNAAIVPELVALRERFLARANESANAIEHGIESLQETAEREEFAHVFKLSVELIRHKARAQASRVIVDELSAVLESSKRGVPLGEESSRIAAEREREREQRRLEAERPVETPSNVIPLKRRFAAGGRHGR